MRMTREGGGAIIKKSSFFLVLALCLCVGWSGCASKDRSRLTEAEQASIKRIAVVPFQRLIPDDTGGRVVRCPICGTMYPACTLPEDAEENVYDVFVKKLGEHKKYTLLPPDRVAAVFNRIDAQDMKASPAEKLRKVGQELEADGVVIGYVSCFRERVGYALSAERPASVTFGVYLVRVSDGAVVWGKIFDKTQRAVMENLFQASGLTWLTARQLAEQGVGEILTTFPGLN